jgi:hypothetical protein
VSWSRRCYPSSPTIECAAGLQKTQWPRIDPMTTDHQFLTADDTYTGAGLCHLMRHSQMCFTTLLLFDVRASAFICG